MPVQAGIQQPSALDSRDRGNDKAVGTRFKTSS